MGLLGDKLREFSLYMETLERSAPARPLDVDDFDLFDRAVNERPPKTHPEAVDQHMRRRNFFRWRRLRRDYRWLQREMRKMGMNPDEARWYL